uniref:Uncharacterized protein n=1 Tax=Ciona intestinalis TaxID=7719 RepID=H2XLV5_CIOIN
MANTGFHISLYATFLLIFVTLLQTNCEEKCFCQLSGQIDDCFCDIETLEKFNNEQVFPLVSQLVKRDFFRYYKVNMFKPCNYFDGDIGFCESESCGVKPCSEEDLPVGLRNGNFNKHTPDTEDVECNKPKKSISDINGTLRWDKHDDTVHQFCDIDDESSIELQYIDLIANPERYTGYKGPMAWRIWRAIYEENCFIAFSKLFCITRPETMSQNVNPFKRIPQGKIHRQHIIGMCLEKRVFYRVISGLHTSINTHLSAKYLFEGNIVIWEANLAEFQRRFDKDVTKGEGTARLKNLYFIYLLELRALSKAAEYFNRGNVVLFTGRDKEDVKTKEMLTQLLDLTKKFPMHFDEGVMFQDKNSRGLKREFVQRFLNVTRIIDCVTCEKCRLWGKLQTQGLGTALKVLFSAKEMNGKSDSPFQLIRQEVVSLINAFARLSESIKYLQTFKTLH